MEPVLVETCAVKVLVVRERRWVAVKNIQFTPVVRSSMQLPTRLLAPTFVGSQGRAVPASWRASDGATKKRHGGMTAGATALDPPRASLV